MSLISNAVNLKLVLKVKTRNLRALSGVEPFKLCWLCWLVVVMFADSCVYGAIRLQVMLVDERLRSSIIILGVGLGARVL